VFFDDLKVTHVKSPIVSTSDYYAFGLAFNSYQRENSVTNQYQYNSKEMQDELGLGWLDYGARMYTPEIGRFMKVDFRAHNYMMYSPYGYVVNNPTNNVDYNGDFILPKEFLNRFQRIAQYLANDIQGILENKTIVRALKKHGGFSDKQLKEVFTWGQGPVVQPSDLGPNLEILGLTGGIKGMPAPLKINIDLFEALEKAEGKDRDYWLFLIAVTILHETVHYGYIQNGLTTETEEEGNDFEMDVYGELIKERTGSHKRVMDEWLKRQEIRRSSSSSGPGLEFFWIPSNTSTTTSRKSKKEPDADRKSSKRSGGAH
jgi:RHS repeat-associated protein